MLGIRNEFLVHKRKTVESFRFVRADVSSIMISLEHIKNMLLMLESKASAMGSNSADLKNTLDKYLSDIEGIIKSTAQISDAIENFNTKLKKMDSKNQEASKGIARNDKSIKNLLPKYKRQSLDIKKLNSALKQSQNEIRKLKNLFSSRLRTAKRGNLELEARITSQKKRILQLNKKIGGKKPARKISRRTVTRKVTPKKTVTKTITPKKIVTKTVTPKTKTIREIKK
ncbi:hypothetical protein J4234_03020 [Candidatus Woesearchaeota archaeon]|nr:hypothetical protein [Candidatus Woesearchaeota archaeon]